MRNGNRLYLRYSLTGFLLLFMQVLPAQIPLPRTLWSGPDTVTVAIAGDIMLHGKQIEKASRPDGTFDFSPFLENVEPLIAGADIAIANLEFPLAGPPYQGYPCFSAPDEYACYLADKGFDIFLAANNHILDQGPKGAWRTHRVFEAMKKSHGIRYAGLGATEALSVARKGIRIAFVNWTYGTNYTGASGGPVIPTHNRDSIGRAIREARERGVDFVIALPHWGIEYTHRHTQAQHDLARFVAAEGADAIIGSHPHVVQDMEILTEPAFNGIGTRKVPVWYSLGNLVSNMSVQGTRIGLILLITLVKDRDRLTRYIAGIKPVFTWCTLPGKLTDSYATLPVQSWLGRREDWKITEDYDNMVRSYKSVKKTTGIQDEENN
jgi:poly-gamma-glutamate synthesis protein (capsule biosynthesis protein)